MITTFLFLCNPLTLLLFYLALELSLDVQPQSCIETVSGWKVPLVFRWSWPICLRRNRTAEHPSPVNINEDHTTIDFY